MRLFSKKPAKVTPLPPPEGAPTPPGSVAGNTTHSLHSPTASGRPSLTQQFSSTRGAPQELSQADQWVLLPSGDTHQDVIRPQPSFESRSSSLASLPPGASPPNPYHPPPQPQQQTRRPPSTVSHPYEHPPTSSDNLYEPSVMSNQEKQDKPKRGIFASWGHDKEKEREREKHKADIPGAWDLTRIMGFLTATASEDWALVLEVCEQASSEAGAKEAAKALKNEFRFAEPPAMLSAARLWAIMLRNASPAFIAQCGSKKFLEVVEEAIDAERTSPVVRERLIFVVAGAAAQFGDKYPSFRSCWKKFKSREAPLEGIPFDPRDPMFNPPARKLPRPGVVPAHGDPRPQSMTMQQMQQYQALPPQVPVNTHPQNVVPYQTQTQAQAQAQPASHVAEWIQQQQQQPPQAPLNHSPSVRRESKDHHKDRSDHYRDRDRDRDRSDREHRKAQKAYRSRDGRFTISPEEDIARLFQECEIAKGNAHVLCNALAYAKPGDLEKNSSFYKEFYGKCKASEEIIVAQIPWASAGAEKSRHLQQQSLGISTENEGANGVQIHPALPLTMEEELLAALLKANEELTDAFRIYDQLQMLAIAEREEREVQERSRSDTRMDRRQLQYLSPDGLLLNQTSGGGSGQSRSPSPSPRTNHPLPMPPSSPQVNAGNVISAYQQFNGSQNALAPPQQQSHHLHGPRQPRSRSPSPDGRFSSNGNSRAVDTLRKGMNKLGLGNGTVRLDTSTVSLNGSHLNVSGEDDEIKTPVQPSLKALGKRRADPPQEEPNFEQDDFFRNQPGIPLLRRDDTPSDSDSLDEEGNPKRPRVVYAYDAAAEREKEMVLELKRHRNGVQDDGSVDAHTSPVHGNLEESDDTSDGEDNFAVVTTRKEQPVSAV
ncbi:hypothetical protein FRC02_011678 [Tulasnella sp. 418]|nr:hypothetical protein FRC02_011678 [Tulasnella sp. 418]